MADSWSWLDGLPQARVIHAPVSEADSNDQEANTTQVIMQAVLDPCFSFSAHLDFRVIVTLLDRGSRSWDQEG
jgi:hypothetical protein